MKFSISKKMLVVTLSLVMVACTFDQVLADINLLIGIAGAIIPALGQLSPADAAEAQKIAQIATDGMALVKKDYEAVKASGATADLDILRAAIKAVNDNLAEELAVVKVSNPALVYKVTAWVNLFSVSLNAILTAFPPSTGAKVSVKKIGQIPTKASIKRDWANNVCGGVPSCVKLVK